MSLVIYRNAELPEKTATPTHRLTLDRSLLRFRRQNKIVAIAGRKGSGKSALTRVMLERAQRLFLFDSMGEHHWVEDRFDQVDRADWYIQETAATREQFVGSLVPQQEDLDADFGLICDSVYDQGNILFGIEEVPMLCTPQHAPESFKRLFRLGRHHNVNMLYTAQRLGECNRGLTAATDVFILFSAAEPRDLDAISERCEPDCARAVAALAQHEFLVWDVSERSYVKVVDNRWYDSLVLSETNYYAGP